MQNKYSFTYYGISGTKIDEACVDCINDLYLSKYYGILFRSQKEIKRY